MPRPLSGAAAMPMCRWLEPVSIAIWPGAMQPRPMQPRKASAPPWATGKPTGRPRCAAALRCMQRGAAAKSNLQLELSAISLVILACVKT